MIHLGLQSINLLKLRSTIRQEGVWMFLGVSGPWLLAWLSFLLRELGPFVRVRFELSEKSGLDAG